MLVMAMTMPMYMNTTAQDFADNPGLWSAVIRSDHADIEFGGRHWNSSSTFPLSELGTLPTGKTGAFTVKRDAGTVTFNGAWEGNRGHGTYAFEKDPSFVSFLAQEGFSDVSEELMLHFFFTNINKAYFGYMKENGYTGITLSELKELAYQDMNQRVLTSYLEIFKKNNYGKVSIEMIVELREHGVSPAFIEGVRQMGYTDLSLETAKEMVDHGVSLDFITEMQKIGGRHLTLDEAIELVDHGVSASFVRELVELGYKDISLEKARELVDHGVSISFIRSFIQLGYKDISPDKAQELVDHGVSADYIKQMQAKGLKNLTLDQYIRLKDGGM